jgi:hypothetical protein
MRFQVSYGSGTTHQVELPGSVVVLGRDPGCDIVLNDTKCSRRHAVVEGGPEGLVIRDSGSANGVYLNGRRVESAPLSPGDTIRLGDVRLTLLAEIGETVVVALDDAELAPRSFEPGPPLLPERQPPPHEPRPFTPRPGSEPSGARPLRPPGRPATVGVLSALWALFAPISAAVVILEATRHGAGLPAWLAVAILCLALVGASVAMSLGLWALAPWARHLQIVAAYLGLVVCPFTLVSATVLLYLGRPDVRRSFEPASADRARDGAGTAEPTFAISILAMLVVGLVLGAAALLVLWPRRQPL